MASGFKVDEVIARSLVAELINLLLGLFLFNFGFLLRVRNDVAQVFHQVPEPAFNAPLTHHHHPLPVLPLFGMRLSIFKCPQLVLGINLWLYNTLFFRITLFG